jgi:mRNA interferase MazF
MEPIRQRDLWLVALGAGRNGEPGKNRPCVVITADEARAGTDHDLIIVAPLTTSRAATPLRPALAAGHGITSDSAVLCDGLRAIVPGCFLTRLGSVPTGQFREIMGAIRLVLWFEP